MPDDLPAEVSPSSPASNDEERLVTVAVPARDEEGAVARCVSSILEQDEARLQVIVVDGGSTDRTAAIVDALVATDHRIETIRFGAASIPGSMNAALECARGRWFVRVDAHSTIPSDYVRRAVAHLETGRWGGVGGRKDAVADTTVGRAIAAALGSRFGVGNSVYHHGTRPRVVDHVPFGAYETDTLRRLGGWDRRLTANEDFELDRRVRVTVGPLLFDPELRIAWRCRESIGDLFRQYVRYGIGKADVAFLHPFSLRPRHLAPPAAVVLLTGAAATAFVAPGLGLALAAPYGLVLVVASAVTARRVRGAAAKATLPVAFASMHLGWGIGFLKGLVANATGRGPRRRGDPPAPIERPAVVGAGDPTSETVAGDGTAAKRDDDTTTRRIA